MGDIERWHLDHDGHEHIIEVAQGAVIREVVWTRGGTEVGRKKTSDETIVVAPNGEDAAVRLKFLIPILIAFFIARGEVKRRRKAEEKKATTGDSTS